MYHTIKSVSSRFVDVLWVKQGGWVASQETLPLDKFARNAYY